MAEPVTNKNKYIEGVSSLCKKHKEEVDDLTEQLAFVMDQRDAARKEAERAKHTLERIRALLENRNLWDDEKEQELRRLRRDNAAKAGLSVNIGTDGMCTCNCVTTCPLGRTGMAYRCTAEELFAAGVRMLVVAPQQGPPQAP